VSCEGYAKWLQENSTADDSLAEYLKTAAVQKCPKCKSMAELITGGCKFMYCRCKAKFCFLCGLELTEKDHYAHFSAPQCTGPFGQRCIGMKGAAVAVVSLDTAAVANMLAASLKAMRAVAKVKRPRR
jgi:predicted RNA-binding Zn-ribbon protein involved in translation (DUF1610 family)